MCQGSEDILQAASEGGSAVTPVTTLHAPGEAARAVSPLSPVAQQCWNYSHCCHGSFFMWVLETELTGRGSSHLPPYGFWRPNSGHSAFTHRDISLGWLLIISKHFTLLSSSRYPYINLVRLVTVTKSVWNMSHSTSHSTHYGGLTRDAQSLGCQEAMTLPHYEN